MRESDTQAGNAPGTVSAGRLPGRAPESVRDPRPFCLAALIQTYAIGR